MSTLRRKHSIVVEGQPYLWNACRKEPRRVLLKIWRSGLPSSQVFLCIKIACVNPWLDSVKGTGDCLFTSVRPKHVAQIIQEALILGWTAQTKGIDREGNWSESEGLILRNINHNTEKGS